MAEALRTRLTAGEAAFLDQALVSMQWSPSGGGTRELSVAEQQLGFQLEMASLSLAGGGLAIELLSEYLEAWHSSLPDVFGRVHRGGAWVRWGRRSPAHLTMAPPRPRSRRRRHTCRERAQ